MAIKRDKKEEEDGNFLNTSILFSHDLFKLKYFS